MKRRRRISRKMAKEDEDKKNKKREIYEEI